MSLECVHGVYFYSLLVALVGLLSHVRRDGSQDVRKEHFVYPSTSLCLIVFELLDFTFSDIFVLLRLLSREVGGE